MAIAGSTQEAFFLRMDGDRLVVLGKHRLLNHLIEEDVANAAKLLRSGRAIYLLAHGDNLTKIKEIIH